MRHGFPPTRPGMVIGLLGGSFDPAHAGHAHITREALKRLDLDRVWWLVSPGNPLKARGPVSLDRRMARARAVMQDPRVAVTDVEARLGTRHTARTIAALQNRLPGVRLVWLMGADNMAQVHLWRDWTEIFARVPVAVLARPDQRGPARHSPAAERLRRAYVPVWAARGLGRRDPPAWTFLDMPMHDASSTRIRRAGGWD
ncbi:nicotinate-nucleotide adenylyltransferase [Jannaschia sp. S6380]|uniref:nicotinate-nucleotide adenylyltransferase n=1 Tax=Jannaschia sp. S6380 TaxID=2926408 RepID=UPI001FF32994|nr:nicotinate-nucleotide adenylyltransferase [Jannaschia sp. S6380]MCK0168240.1 nicotinate-nucleotide adenylyltransferase [Jannaschia sp. S6380]